MFDCSVAGCPGLSCWPWTVSSCVLGEVWCAHGAVLGKTWCVEVSVEVAAMTVAVSISSSTCPAVISTQSRQPRPATRRAEHPRNEVPATIITYYYYY
jgi:hypothetical protein